MTADRDIMADPPVGEHRPVVVVPCFDEEQRLDEGAFFELAESGGVALLFVDDGSTDGTLPRLEHLACRSPAIHVLALESNVGKAEAVRRGLLWAVDAGAPIAGYLDADLATPADEMARLVRTLEQRSDLVAVFGSRVALLGSDIRRSAFRHYTGRVFATAASVALGVAVYDTQCGAKCFRVNESFVAAIQAPFQSRWAFDVVLSRRLLEGTGTAPGLPPSAFLEVPLTRWNDVAGSKVTLTSGVMALVEVMSVGLGRFRRSRTETRAAGVRPTEGPRG